MIVMPLDDSSRAAVARFLVKVCVSLFLASLSKTGYLAAASVWLTLYAVITALLASLRRERFEPKSFNHWDEALWLTAVSQALQIAAKATV